MIARYSLALLVSVALLFLLEPMVAKFVLPLLGNAVPRAGGEQAMVQRWLTATRHRAANDPYFLFAASKAAAARSARLSGRRRAVARTRGPGARLERRVRRGLVLVAASAVALLRPAPTIQGRARRRRA